MFRLLFCNFALIPQGARGEIGKKGERGDPGLPVSQTVVFNANNKMWAPYVCLFMSMSLSFVKSFVCELAQFLPCIFFRWILFILIFCTNYFIPTLCFLFSCPSFFSGRKVDIFNLFIVITRDNGRQRDGNERKGTILQFLKI